ncbi:5515_t:CDS:2 [Funneliformis geosporum]|uniref:166_t:CDS:1 n=1 Tax=Funneliformis geosporum TaxID=1117311 RepID=A0A9W4SWP3_9GLOM|nr:5515_t:CDS:2 [Funneliformis geosporum]CAI2184136.1 166_t:CDS:2 [Funneliformis geosporum]
MSFQTPESDKTQQFTNEPAYKRTKRNHSTQNSLNDLVQENKRDFVKVFSDELNLHVFRYLSAADLSICTRVSRKWWRLANDRQLWKNLFLSRFKAPKRPNLTYRLESLQMIPSQINSIPKFQILPDNTCDDMADEEDWKNIYRVSHNWQTGNCRVIDFKPYVDFNKNQMHHFSSLAGSSKIQPKIQPIDSFTQFHSDRIPPVNSNPLVQFTRHVILTASFSSAKNIPEVHLWRAGKQNEHIDTLRSEILYKTMQKSKFPIVVTCLKLDSNEGKDDTGIHKLIAGYSNGGFTIWEFDSMERSSTDDKTMRKWRHREIFTLHSSRAQNPLIACALHFPVLVTCTEDFELSIYFMDYKLNNSAQFNSSIEGNEPVEKIDCRLVHQLRSFVCWAPIEISVESITENSIQSSTLNYSSRDVWKATIAYSVPLYGGGWSVGVQEIKFSSAQLISTRHCSSLPSFIPILSENNSAENVEQFSFAPITTITYNAGQLVTAHFDNTLQVYHVLEQGRKLECRHECTLYGHTGSVMSVALDEHGKLITGSMDHSIKIWDLGWNLVKNNEGRKSKDRDDILRLKSTNHQDTEFSTVGISAKRKKHGECIVTLSDSLNNIRENNNFGIKWVGFDEGRIVSVCGGNTTIIKDKSRGSINNNKGTLNPPPGWTDSVSREKVDSQSNDMEDVGIIKVWSFCDE